ncbi:oxidoreductase alpha (molybdopterin) subunit [Flavobacteriaceae bacterium MAR_2010_188]|nr:oxidoreductase alpha (molybdopterin) subunit [Flavobacteriaceae bacterium MAR_2010_188]
MENEFKRKISVRGPEDFRDLEFKDPVTHAAGKIAIKETIKHTFKEMGIVDSMRALFTINQKDGFDCPSCAWPDPEKPSPIGEYCESGAKALADESTHSKIGAKFFSEYSVEELSNLSDFQLNKFGRLVDPLILRKGSIYYEPITWEDVYKTISQQLKELDTPDEAIFYTSGRSSNEAAFLYGMFIRAYGTNNMPDCSNMCHESSGVALSETLGIGKGTTTLEDMYEAEVIIIAGQNPGTNHPRMMSALEKCKNNGGYIISVNPLEETGLVNFKNPQNVTGLVGGGVDIADLHFAININQDIPLVKLILKKLADLDAIDKSVFDHEFLKEYTQGYQALIEDLKSFDESELLRMTGVSEEIVDEAVKVLSKKTKIIVCWAMGLTQHKNAVETIKEYINLLLLKGAIGKENCGSCPIRGHSNVQGDRSVGIQHFVDKDLNERIEKHMGFTPPAHKGVDVVESMEKMHKGEAKFFMSLGGNFVMACSDTDYTAEAIQGCEMTVQISTKLNRSHLVTGKTALVLPTFGRSEKDEKDGKTRFLTTENSMGRVRQSKGILKPASDNIKSEPEIIGGLADTFFGGNHPVDWKKMGEDYELIREKIDLVAKGFENTSERSKGVGYYLPNNARVRDFSALPNGKAQLTLNNLPDHRLEDDELLLMTIRSHDQFNTTIYGMDDRYRGVYNERRVLFMNPKDIEERDLEKFDVVDLSSTYDEKKRTAYNFKVLPYKIPVGNVAAYFPETNPLVPYNHYSDKSNTPISKSVKIRIHKKVEENVS